MVLTYETSIKKHQKLIVFVSIGRLNDKQPEMSMNKFA